MFFPKKLQISLILCIFHYFCHSFLLCSFWNLYLKKMVHLPSCSRIGAILLVRTNFMNNFSDLNFPFVRTYTHLQYPAPFAVRDFIDLMSPAFWLCSFVLFYLIRLNPLRPMLPSYRNQSIDLHSNTGT